MKKKCLISRGKDAEKSTVYTVSIKVTFVCGVWHRDVGWGIKVKSGRSEQRFRMLSYRTVQNVF
jgi:hypothetical protein